MSLDECKERIETIRNMGDPEISHGMEDQLAIEVLTACAEGKPESREMAKLTSEVLCQDRVRWYA